VETSSIFMNTIYEEEGVQDVEVCKDHPGWEDASDGHDVRVEEKLLESNKIKTSQGNVSLYKSQLIVEQKGHVGGNKGLRWSVRG